MTSEQFILVGIWNDCPVNRLYDMKISVVWKSNSTVAKTSAIWSQLD